MQGRHKSKAVLDLLEYLNSIKSIPIPQLELAKQFGLNRSTVSKIVRLSSCPPRPRGRIKGVYSKRGVFLRSKIKSLKAIGYNQNKIARTLGLSRQRVHQLVTGYRSPASNRLRVSPLAPPHRPK